MKKVYSVLINEYFDQDKVWKKHYNFYKGDLSEVEFGGDWRFNEIPDKRKQAIFVGTITDPSFPLEYPIYLDNGKVLDKM